MSDLDFLGNYSPEAAAAEAKDGDFKPLPPGWYRCKVTAAEVVDFSNARGSGKMVKVRLDVEGPTHAGRVVFDQTVVAHSGSKDAQDIGRAKFGQLCIAAGYTNSAPPNIRDIIGTTVDAKLKVEKSTNPRYEDQNRAAAFRVPQSMASAPAAPAPEFDDSDIPF